MTGSRPTINGSAAIGVDTWLRSRERISTASLIGLAALYCLSALAWSLARCDVILNARSATAVAAIALSVALIAIVASSGEFASRDGFYGWNSIAVGIALLAAAEIAGLNVVWNDGFIEWRPDSLVWLQAIGTLFLLFGLLCVKWEVIGHRECAANAIGLVALSLALTAPFGFGVYLWTLGDSHHPLAMPSLLGVAFALAAVAISIGPSVEQGTRWTNPSPGLALISGSVALGIAFETYGTWVGSPGIISLGRWVLPIAALGAASAIDVRDHMGPVSHPHDWASWPVIDGPWPTIGTLVLTACAAISLAIGATIGPQIVALASLCLVALLCRQGMMLKIERGRTYALKSSADEFQRLANVDTLTGLPNRAALDARILEEFERAFRYDQPMSILFIDIDHFKQINDRLGHAAGDQVLRRIADGLRQTARSIDFVGRYGGEEFLVIAPGTWTADATILGERLRVQSQELTADGTITISIGIAGFPEHAMDSKSLIERADRALYTAKSSGRNRAVLYASAGDDT
jgi:diguanylate cyclase (GGDEF)-like protein